MELAVFEKIILVVFNVINADINVEKRIILKIFRGL
jgi:hypothetical protein